MELLESKFTLKMGECIWESGFNSTENGLQSAYWTKG